MEYNVEYTEILKAFKTFSKTNKDEVDVTIAAMIFYYEPYDDEEEFNNCCDIARQVYDTLDYEIERICRTIRLLYVNEVDIDYENVRKWI